MIEALSWSSFTLSFSLNSIWDIKVRWKGNCPWVAYRGTEVAGWIKRVQGISLLFSFIWTAPGIFVRRLLLLLGIFSVLWLHYPSLETNLFRAPPHSAAAALSKEVKGQWLIRLDMVSINLSPLTCEIWFCCFDGKWPSASLEVPS